MTAVEAQPVIPEAVDFLARLHDGEAGHLSMFAVDRRTGDKIVQWAELPDVTPITTRAAELAATHCVWVGVAPRSRQTGSRRGRAEDCVTIPGLWVDIDVSGEGHAADDLPPTMDAAIQLLRSYPVPPTITIDTGGGLQAYWQFLEPLPVDEAKELVARWGATWVQYAAAHDWGIDNVWDFSRVLRLPGTLNNKTAIPRPVKIIDVDWSRRFGLDDLDQWLVDPPKPPPQAPRSDIPWIGPQRPGDAFNASVDPAALLERAGCIFDHAEGGDRHYRAPHRTARGDTTGITIYADGHTTIYSETFARAHGMQVKRPYDPFGLYTHIHHAGQWRDATAALVELGYGERPVDLASLIAPVQTAMTVDEPRSDDDWAPRNLADLARAIQAGEHAPEVPLHLEVDGGMPLFYPGRLHSIFGPPGGGKTWVALCALVERLHAGEHVLMIDWEDAEQGTTQRLLQLGCTPDELERFDYRNPSTSLLYGFDTLSSSTTPWALIVMDSAGEALAAQGVELNDDMGTAQWMQLAKKLARRPELPSVVMLDHVPKAGDEPAKYAIGSQRKLAAITGASYRCDTLIEPAKGKPGKLKLVVAKDRLGNRAKGATACEVHLADDGDLLDVRFAVSEAQAAAERGEKFRPTVLMERVSRWLEFHPGATQNEIRKDVSGKAEHVKTALSVLVEEGFVRVDKIGQAHQHTNIKSYFESSDLALIVVDNSQNAPTAPRAPTAPLPRPGTGEVNRAPRAPGLTTTQGAGRGYTTEAELEIDQPRPAVENQRPAYNPFFDPPEDQ